MPRSFALGEHFERLIDEQVKSGRYGNASEVVRAGLRLLEEREARVAELRRAVEEGRRSGIAGPVEVTLDRLEARYRAMAEAKAER